MNVLISTYEEVCLRSWQDAYREGRLAVCPATVGDLLYNRRENRILKVNRVTIDNLDAHGKPIVTLCCSDDDDDAIYRFDDFIDSTVYRIPHGEEEKYYEFRLCLGDLLVSNKKRRFPFDYLPFFFNSRIAFSYCSAFSFIAS